MSVGRARNKKDRWVYTRCRAADTAHSLGSSGGCVCDHELASFRDGASPAGSGLPLDLGVVRGCQRRSRDAAPLLTLPLMVVTLGLFSIIVNAALLEIIDAISSHLTIDHFFWTAILGGDHPRFDSRDPRADRGCGFQTSAACDRLGRPPSLQPRSRVIWPDKAAVACASFRGCPMKEWARLAAVAFPA